MIWFNHIPKFISSLKKFQLGRSAPAKIEKKSRPYKAPAKRNYWRATTMKTKKKGLPSMSNMKSKSKKVTLELIMG